MSQAGSGSNGIGTNPSYASLLCDCANLVVQANIVEVFEFFPGIYEKINVPKTVKLACLISEDAATAKEMVFYETICRNRGWQIRLFKDRNAAMQWLYGQQEA